ncbi:hypothetical protein ABZ383_08455 [Streptomyces sp. NPDC005900]|uniref:hypothetical protein n=1 Tax=unclassified Streptomyces TaxID=2593676 RepID=UPI0033D479E4
MDPCTPTQFEGPREEQAYWYYDQDGGWCHYADQRLPVREDQRWDNYGDCWDKCG